jgi:hypothetical protein
VLDMQTHVDTTTTVDNGIYKHFATEHRGWPLAINYQFGTTADGYAQTTSVDQGLDRTIAFGIEGYSPRAASLEQRMATSDTLMFDADFNAIGRQDQGSQQSYVYLDPFGACYDRTITTAAGALTAVADGAACPGGVNDLPSFDSFHNAGSLVFGATLQILP